MTASIIIGATGNIGERLISLSKNDNLLGTSRNEKKSLFKLDPFNKRELNAMMMLHHPNICQFFGYVETPFILVMEYLPKKWLLKHYKLVILACELKIYMEIHLYWHNFFLQPSGRNI